MSDLETWIIAQGLTHSDVRGLLEGVAQRLVAEGIPLQRAYIALPTVNPTFRVFNHIWTPATGAVFEGVSHERDQVAFEQSPFGFMFREGLTEYHWRFDADAEPPFPILVELKAKGATDYLARLVRYDAVQAPALRGMAASFSTKRPGGLLPSEIARIDAMLPILALATYRMALFNLTLSLLDTYVGFSAGRRVLSGDVRRGFGQTLSAALLVADLRGFTTVADQAGAGLIARLDEHLEAMAAPIVAHGGEVLKFLGDGLLAAFPITAERSAAQACCAAVEAARDALRRNRTIDEARPGEPPLLLDIALHCGDVFYGNIGAAQRLDFTVIGPAVNEASRIEALCAPLGRSLLMSAAVASACPYPTRSLGHHALRGVAERRELFTIDG